MLKHTFLHVPGIGPVTESRLWAAGYLSWEDYLKRPDACPVRCDIRRELDVHLEQSARALASGEAAYFGSRLPPGEMWRLYSEFRDRVAFVDIETTGLYCDADAITVIGLYDGRRTRVFVKGDNLDQFREEIEKYPVIATFNGKRFDLPFIREAFGGLPEHQAHIDLLYPLRKLGYRGGLKSIEVQLGIEREGALKEMDGFMAVLLWREYQKGNRGALDTLIRYNLEDVVNLQHLADIAYNQALSRLPISLEPLPVCPKFEVDMPFDPDLIRRLRRFLPWRY